MSAAGSLRCELITTGSELLLGRTVNGHLAWLGRELFRLGLRLGRNVSVGDGAEIADELARALTENDLVIVTGGLGPTSDDLTRELVAARLGLELDEDDGTWQAIRERMRRRGVPLQPGQRRQARVPRGARVLANAVGTAPGLWFGPEVLQGWRCRLLLLLPGPPGELQPMWREAVLPRLTVLAGAWRGGEAGTTEVAGEWKIVGKGESEVAARLEPALADLVGRGLELGYCARLGEVDLRLIGARGLVDEAGRRVRELFGEDVVGDGDATLGQVVVAELTRRGQRLALAESCTGGMLAHWLTSVAGSSACFDCGVVAYANEVKQRLLRVEDDLLWQHGAVSAPVAEAMAAGARDLGKADWALAVTGIAGPGGGTEEKPVGTVWLGLADPCGGVESRLLRLSGERARIQELACRQALDWLRRRLQRSQ